MTTAVILAGGLGTRLRSAVPDLPKPMAPVGGRPFLEYLLEYWSGEGIDRFVLSVGYRHEAIRGYFGEGYRGAKIEYVVESIPLGTGGGLLLATDRLEPEEPFLLLNGDTYFPVGLEALRSFSASADSDWCFSLFRANEEGRYMGLEVAPQGKILSLSAGMGQLGRLANGGVYWVRPRGLSPFPRSEVKGTSLENDIFPAALGLGQRLFAMEWAGPFLDIGVPSDYHRAIQVLPRLPAR